MTRRLARFALVLACACGSGSAPRAPAPSGPVALPNLDFETMSDVSTVTPGWDAGGNEDEYTAAIDTTVRRSGARSGRIRSVKPPAEPNAFGSMKSCASPSRYEGRRVTMRAWLRADGAATGFVYLRLDGAPTAFLVNTQSSAVTGTADWTPASLTGTVPRGGHTLCAGFLLQGGGTLWADDFSVEVTPAGSSQDRR